MNEEKNKMQFSVNDREDNELCEAALDELGNNKGDDEEGE